jgi:hypothetical protein
MRRYEISFSTVCPESCSGGRRWPAQEIEASNVDRALALAWETATRIVVGKQEAMYYGDVVRGAARSATVVLPKRNYLSFELHATATEIPQ